MHKILLAAALPLAFASVACNRSDPAAQDGNSAVSASETRSVTVENASVRLPTVKGRPGVAYFTIRADDKAAALFGLSTPAAKRPEMHETVKKDGIMSMSPVTRVDIPAGGSVSFEPGGKHVMLFDMDPALAAGTTTKLTLTFDGMAPVVVDARVEAAGTMAH